MISKFYRWLYSKGEFAPENEDQTSTEVNDMTMEEAVNLVKKTLDDMEAEGAI